jgi:hypothetical protein
LAPAGFFQSGFLPARAAAPARRAGVDELAGLHDARLERELAHADAAQDVHQVGRQSGRQFHRAVVVEQVDLADVLAGDAGLVGDGADDFLGQHALIAADLDAVARQCPRREVRCFTGVSLRPSFAGRSRRGSASGWLSGGLVWLSGLLRCLESRACVRAWISALNATATGAVAAGAASRGAWSLAPGICSGRSRVASQASAAAISRAAMSCSPSMRRTTSKKKSSFSPLMMSTTCWVNWATRRLATSPGVGMVRR